MADALRGTFVDEASQQKQQGAHARLRTQEQLLERGREARRELEQQLGAETDAKGVRWRGCAA